MNKNELNRLAYGSTLMDDGYTLWKDDKKRYKGYVVGGVEHESVCEMDDGLGFRTLFDKYINMLDVRNAYRTLGIGTWVDEGKIFFDIVQHVDDEKDAIAMCVMRGEKAYFDILEQKSVYLTK
tara:strand:- start:780 stop:1148 length:369 start_codon:yes stop_codon:yes gene_type:complete